MIILTAPVWFLVIVVFCLVSSLRSFCHWWITGEWLLADELPASRLDHAEATLNKWMIKT